MNWNVTSLHYTSRNIETSIFIPDNIPKRVQICWEECKVLSLILKDENLDLVLFKYIFEYLFYMFYSVPPPRSQVREGTLKILGITLGAVGFVAVCLICLIVAMKRKRQPKNPDQSGVTKPLMADLGLGGNPSIVGGAGGSQHGTLNSTGQWAFTKKN